MGVSPDQYSVSLNDMKLRLGLGPNDAVFEYGYEKQCDNFLIYQLKNDYGPTSLFIRTRPDFIVRKNGSWYFVEAKQKDDTVEAVQLHFNKEVHKMGIPVIYSFPEYYVPCSAIDIDYVYVPSRYSSEFTLYLKSMIQAKNSMAEFTSLKETNGSGDAFVKLNKEWLREFAREWSI